MLARSVLGVTLAAAEGVSAVSAPPAGNLSAIAPLPQLHAQGDVWAAAGVTLNVAPPAATMPHATHPPAFLQLPQHWQPATTSAAQADNALLQPVMHRLYAFSGHNHPRSRVVAPTRAALQTAPGACPASRACSRYNRNHWSTRHLLGSLCTSRAACSAYGLPLAAQPQPC